MAKTGNWLFALGACTTLAFMMILAYTDHPSTSVEATLGKDLAKGEHPIQQIKVPKIPDSVDLAGEVLPLDNFDAKERFDRELLGNCFQHSTTIMNIKLANRYFPIIEPILAKHGIPDDFKYLAVTESNLRNAISPVGARGIWQFMEATAKEFGMVVDNDVDERYDIEKATEAACLYLKQAYKDFGSWTLAAASYNMGKGALKAAIEAQGVSSYYDLHLNNETSRYVPRIIAIKEIMRNPKRYGFFIEKADLYEPLPKYRLIEVEEVIVQWADFAKQNGSTYRMLRIHNPWIMTSKLNNKARRKYTVRLPS